jgi:hypothetical protein
MTVTITVMSPIATAAGQYRSHSGACMAQKVMPETTIAARRLQI